MEGTGHLPGGGDGHGGGKGDLLRYYRPVQSQRVSGGDPAQGHIAVGLGGGGCGVRQFAHAPQLQRISGPGIAGSGIFHRFGYHPQGVVGGDGDGGGQVSVFRGF